MSHVVCGLVMLVGFVYVRASGCHGRSDVKIRFPRDFVTGSRIHSALPRWLS